MDSTPESTTAIPVVVDEIAKKKDTRQRVRESHVGLYLITRFAAV